MIQHGRAFGEVATKSHHQSRGFGERLLGLKSLDEARLGSGSRGQFDPKIFKFTILNKAYYYYSFKTLSSCSKLSPSHVTT